MRPSIARVSEQLDPRLQLADIPPPQSVTIGLHPVARKLYIHMYIPRNVCAVTRKRGRKHKHIARCSLRRHGSGSVVLNAMSLIIII